MQNNLGFQKAIMGVFIVVFVISFMSVVSGVFSSESDQYNVNVTQFVSADKGLDLAKVGALLANVDSAEDFEKKLNSLGEHGSGVNNLDLNEDGVIDYINVQEWGEGTTRGFILTTEVAKDDVQELARIKIEKTSDKDAKVEIQGNENIYGNNHYYHHRSSGGFGTGLMMGYLFASHRPYYSPYGYGRYPGGYSRYGTVSNSAYNRGGSGKGWTSGSKSSVPGKVNSPYKGKTASNIKAPIKNPSQAQKAFQKRNPTKQSRGRAFGRSGSRSSSSSAFGRRSSTSRRSFGRSGGWGK